MNILIAGCGQVGKNLAVQLSKEGHEITVMDVDYTAVEAVQTACDVIGYQGDCTSLSAQMDAGIQDMDILIAASNQDEKNMLACLIARKAGNVKTIARVRDPQYLDEMYFLKEELGLSMSINPERVAAEDLLRLIQIPSALEVDTFAKGKVSLIRLVIPQGSILDGLALKDYASKVGTKALVCVVERGKNVIIPGGDFVLAAGDSISITVSLVDLNELLMKIGIKTRRIRNVMIAGGGMISYYLARQLLAQKIEVKIIEKNPKRCEELADMLPKAMIIQGDATDKTLLVEESIEEMDAVCALMGSDEANILLSLYVDKVSDAKRMIKIHRDSYEDMVADLPVGTIISTKKITSEYITRFVRSMNNSADSNVEALYRLMDGRVEALEFNVGEDSRVTWAAIRELNIRKNTLICCINREGKIIRPAGNDRIRKGDSVVVVTTEHGLNGVDDILER
ncbi:MAG: Trk system potassium transporter TrkA [Eubacterium sp.]|nr:Trk system potassium transporter TrkA [Eubacterium sp.]